MRVYAFDRDVLTLYPRARRLCLIKQVCPDADSYVVVDDQDLSAVSGWTYYSPQAFVEQSDGHDFGRL